MNAPGLEFFILGGVALRGLPAEEADQLLAQNKVVALLAYLALSPARRHQRRDRIAALLWPELDQAHARAALRKTVHLVRAALGEDVVVGRGDEELALDPDRLWCDAVEFTRGADEGRLLQALELYKGDLLPGFHLPGCGEFTMWLEDERTTAQVRASAAAWALALRLEGESKHTDAAGWARTAVRYAWSDERVLRRTILMLDRLGDRAGALRLFDDISRRLQRELGAAPSAETTALVERLRQA